MSGGERWPNRFTPPNDDWLDAPWGYAMAPTPSPTGGYTSRGLAPLPRSLSFMPISSDSDRGGLAGPSWPIEERVMTLPGHSGFASSRVPQNRDRYPVRPQLAIPEPPSPTRFTGHWGPPVPSRHEEDSKLSPDEQKAALKNLKKEIYNPTPKRFSMRVSLYYREQARAGAGAASDATRNGHPDHDDGKRCAICLEDFEPKEEVRVTPCDHMFHEECIVPWLKSHGQCPVCRSMLYDRPKQNQSPYNNARNLGGNNLMVEEIASMIRLMEEAIRAGRI